MNLPGLILAGGEVTETIKSGVIDPTQFIESPDLLALGMLSALFASGAWLFIATKMGWPVSGTHTIIGALIGFACITIGPSSVDWSTIGGIVGSWFITPVIAGLLAYTIFASIQKLIFDTENPLKMHKIWSLLHGYYCICALYRDYGKRFKTRWFKSFNK